jgi:hypothetical protein
LAEILHNIGMNDSCNYRGYRFPADLIGRAVTRIIGPNSRTNRPGNANDRFGDSDLDIKRSVSCRFTREWTICSGTAAI